jgi:hypothetical protein
MGQSVRARGEVAGDDHDFASRLIDGLIEVVPRPMAAKFQTLSEKLQRLPGRCDPHAFWWVKPTSSKAFSGRGIMRAAIKPSTAANDIQSPGMARFPVI